MNFPADGVAVNGDGTLTAGFGFFVAPLDRTGEPVWPQVKDQADNQLIEQVEFAPDNLLLARSANNRGEGGAFIHRADGRKWRLDAGAHSSGIGTARLSFDGSVLAVATGGAAIEPVVSVYELRDQVTFLRTNFSSDSVITGLALNSDGTRLVLATGLGLEIRSAGDGQLLHRVPMEIVNLEPDPLGRVVYVTTPADLRAVDMDGRVIWQNANFAPRRLAVSHNFLAAVTGTATISILAATGSHLGDATTLAPVRGIAMTREVDILIAASAEQRLQAWQLPAPL